MISNIRLKDLWRSSFLTDMARIDTSKTTAKERYILCKQYQAAYNSVLEQMSDPNSDMFKEYLAAKPKRKCSSEIARLCRENSDGRQ